MAATKEKVLQCDTVAILAGCEHSKGTRLEVLIAERLDMTVVNAHDLVTRKTVGVNQRDDRQAKALS